MRKTRDLLNDLDLAISSLHSQGLSRRKIVILRDISDRLPRDNQNKWGETLALIQTELGTLHQYGVDRVAINRLHSLVYELGKRSTT